MLGAGDVDGLTERVEALRAQLERTKVVMDELADELTRLRDAGADEAVVAEQAGLSPRLVAAALEGDVRVALLGDGSDELDPPGGWVMRWEDPPDA